MAVNLLINKNNLIDRSNNSIYEYKFLSGNYQIKDNDVICISAASIPYSIFNITGIYGNNKFNISWPVGLVQIPYNITIPDGFYTVDTLNQYLELYMIQNGLYLIDMNASNVFYIKFLYNPTYYSVMMTFYEIPLSLPTGWTQPPNFIGYPTATGLSPSVTILNNAFQQYIGFIAGTYGGSGNLAVNGSLIPQGANVNTLIIRCSLVNNPISSTSDILDSFNIDVPFGSNIIYSPSFEKWVRLYPGRYSSMVVSIVDQDLNTVKLNDPNILITFLIKSS